MKTKKVTVGAIALSALVLIVIVVLFATSAEGESEAGNVAETEMEATDDIEALEEIDVPDIVLEAANEWVKQGFVNIEDDNYLDWRVESLEYAYTYEDFEGMMLQVYRMNYEYLIDDPEQIILAGGMSIDEEGWLVPSYPNCTYLFFEQVGEELLYLTTFMENDSYPGGELFTDDLRLQLGFDSQLSWRVNTYDALSVEAIVTKFAQAYFTNDIDAIKQYLTNQYDWNIEMYSDVSETDEFYIGEIKGLADIGERNIGEACIVSLEYKVAEDADTYQYLTIELIKQSEGIWKVQFYGTEM